MKKKGFTLVELLGVIGVIGFISLIVVPIIISVYEKSRREAFKDSVLNAFRQLDYYMVENKITDIPIEGMDINKIGLPKGSFQYGVFRANEENKAKAINVSDGNYCAVGTQEDLKVFKGACDLTTPICELEIRGEEGVGGWYVENPKVVTTTSKALTGGLTFGIGKEENYEHSVENGKIGKAEYQTTESEKERVHCYVRNIGEAKGTNWIDVPIDKTEPSKAGFTYQLTSKSIRVFATGEDLESGISRYQFSKDGGATWTAIQSGNSYVFDNLKTGEYEIKVRVYNGTYIESKKENNLKKESETKVVKTIELQEPTYKVNPTVWTKGNVEVTITYGEEGVKLLKTDVPVTSNVVATKCSNVYNGAYTCEGGQTTNIEAGSWYKVEANAVITFEKNGNIVAQVVDGVNYKGSSGLQISNIDKTPPTDVKLSISTVRTDRLTVGITCKDNESGIAKYEFSINNGATWINTNGNTSYVFAGLTQGKSYTVKGRCTNRAGGSSEAASAATTGNLVQPTFTNISSTIASGYTRPTRRVIRINYTNTNVANPVYYFRTTVSATVSSGVVTGVCGTGASPGACSNSSVTTLAANTWYRTGSTAPNITYSANGVLYATIGDGTNLVAASNLSISDIDVSAPTVPAIAYVSGANSCTWKNNYSIKLTASDDKGIHSFQIDHNGDGVVDGTVSSAGAWVPPNGYNSCSVRFRTVDQAGRVSGWTAGQHIHQDTQAPGVPGVSGIATTCGWKNNITISLSASDNVGISYYEYDLNKDGVADVITGSSTQMPASWTPPHGWSTCNVRFRAVDPAGNKGAWTGYYHAHQDKGKPTVSVTQSGKNLSMTFGDSNSGLAGYTITTTTATPSSWTAISGASASRQWSASGVGTYYVHVKDNAGNTNFAGPYTMTANYFCSVSINTSWGYNYTGAVQTFSTPCTGLYKLEVYGAQGGSYGGAVGGKGGYSYGNISLAQGQQLYIQVGGRGGAASPSHATQTSGGYNGGGSGGTWSYLGRTWYGSGGGGASHIATTNRGVLSNYNSYRGEVIIVAGGGGGSIYDTGGSYYGQTYPAMSRYGGAGGGSSGSSGDTAGGYYGTGGTQSAGGTCANPTSNTITEASFGRGAYVNTGGFAGGGGGWYGGGAGISYGGAGGGSGYLNGPKLASYNMENDKREGNGYVKITLVSIN